MTGLHEKGRSGTTRTAFSKSNRSSSDNSAFTTYGGNFQTIRHRIADEAQRHAPNSEMRVWLNLLGGLA